MYPIHGKCHHSLLSRCIIEEKIFHLAIFIHIFLLLSVQEMSCSKDTGVEQFILVIVL